VHRRLAVLMVLGWLLPAACAVRHAPPAAPPPDLLPVPTPSPTPEPQDKDPLAVRREPDPVIVAAWAEPPHLPPGGGQAHILIRVQRRGGAPAADVEVRLHTSRGHLYSGGQILRTDKAGRTRDLLTTRRTSAITLNAGGTRYSFVVPVLPSEAAG